MIEKLLTIVNGGVPCFFHSLTGYYCPGCGGTRASYAFLHGHFIRSFMLHPIIDYAFVILLIYIILWIKYKIDRKYRPTEKLLAIVLYTGVAIIIINCLIKNYYLVVKGIDLLK